MAIEPLSPSSSSASSSASSSSSASAAVAPSSPPRSVSFSSHAQSPLALASNGGSGSSSVPPSASLPPPQQHQQVLPPPLQRRKSVADAVAVWGQSIYQDLFIAVRGFFTFLRDPAVAAVVIAAILTHAFQTHRHLAEEGTTQVTFFEENIFETLYQPYSCQYRPHVPYFERDEVPAVRVLLASNETGMRAVTGASNGGKSTAYCMAAEALRGVIYIPFKQKSAEESTELFLARTLRFSGPKPTERLVGGVLREPLQRALQRMRVEHNIKPVFILDDVQVGLVPHTALFDRDFGAALTMLGDMSHDLLLVAMSSDRRFISALQRLPGVRDRLKVVVWPYLPDNTVEKYLTHAVPALRFPAEDAALIARTVGGHMGNIVECIIDTPRYGLRNVLHTIVARAAEQFRDVLLTPPCASGALICDDAQLNGFEVIAFELFDAMRDCQTDVDVMVHAVITRCTRMRIPARSVRRAVNALIEENILRHVDAERVGWHAPRFCAAWQGVSNEVEVRAAIAQARASLAEAAAMPATHQAASSSAAAHATAHA